MDSGRWEAEWLDFTAGMLSDRLRTLPIERIAVQLATTLDSVACAFAVRDGERAWCLVWQLAAPGRAHKPRRLCRWETFFRTIGAEYQLGLPINLPPQRYKAFVLGRPTPYSDTEVDFMGTVQRLLVGIDRQLGRYANTVDGSPECEVDGGELTPRETTVLELIATGMTAAAAASRLAIAERTVHKHLERAYRKLDVCDRLSAVLRARGLGLLPDHEDGQVGPVVVVGSHSIACDYLGSEAAAGI